MALPTVYVSAREKIRKWEGGYNKGFTGSGETYRGIDRLFNPSWPGWAIIDKIPNKKNNQYFNNPDLERLVDEWHYSKYWVPSKAADISNEALSIFYFDFYFHKPLQARAAANEAAKLLNENVSTQSNTLTKSVIDSMNSNPAAAYKKIWELRELHYKNKWLNKWNGGSAIYTTTQKGVLNRLYSFPKTIGAAIAIAGVAVEKKK